MKINKGYSLSQFVDYIHSDGTGLVRKLAENFLNVRRYQHFLKQPLTKEIDNILEDDQSIKLEFDNDGVWYNGNFMYWKGRTIHNLFEATKGELKLKNVTI